MGIADALKFGSDQRKDDDIKQVLEALTTTIEGINVKLAGGTSQGGDMSGIVAPIQNMNKSITNISYAVSEVKNAQDASEKNLSYSVSEAQRLMMEGFTRLIREIANSTSVSAASDKSISYSVSETQRMMSEGFARMIKEISNSASMTIASNNEVRDAINNMSGKMEALVRVQVEQVEILRDLNRILKEKYNI
jgi:hypothetical protein